MKFYTKLQPWLDSLEWPRQWKMDMRFGAWNVKTSFSSGSFKTVPSELAKYKLRFNGSARGQMGQGWHGTSR
jgi:hypothetical protein